MPKLYNRAKWRKEDAAMGVKQCGHCQERLPLDDEHFDRDSSRPDGYRSWCKKCRSERKQAEVEHNTKDALQQLMERMDANVLATLSGAPTGGTNLPHQVQSLEQIVSLLGGVRGFAMQFVACLQAAPPGSAVRASMLKKVMEAIQLCSDDAKVSKPRELMSDEELAASVEQRIKRLRIAPIDGEARESA